jgi:signal peptidase I
MVNCWCRSSVPHLLVLFLAIAFVTISQVYPGEPEDSGDCVTKVQFLEVRGNSLAPLINAGQTIKLVYGYYNCHPVEREDIIAYNYVGNAAPIIKIVKAVPGDKWYLRKSNGDYLIVVNDKPLVNSEGKFYQIPESKKKMLQLYVEDYPVLPENTYLILGNQVSGSLDATRFGLIDKSDILGKVGGISNS